jgi:YD repeat-containing protein
MTRSTWDEHGAQIAEQNMDKDGNLINHPESGVAITEYKYDEAGNRIDTLTFDKDRVPVKV